MTKALCGSPRSELQRSSKPATISLVFGQRRSATRRDPRSGVCWLLTGVSPITRRGFSTSSRRPRYLGSAAGGLETHRGKPPRECRRCLWPRRRRRSRRVVQSSRSTQPPGAYSGLAAGGDCPEPLRITDPVKLSGGPSKRAAPGENSYRGSKVRALVWPAAYRRGVSPHEPTHSRPPFWSRLPM